MRERAQVLGGTMFIDSAPGRGTRLRIELPTPGRARAATEAGGGEATEAEQEHG
jgi:signal transduction histidine kinase